MDASNRCASMESDIQSQYETLSMSIGKMSDLFLRGGRTAVMGVAPSTLVNAEWCWWADCPMCVGSGMRLIHIGTGYEFFDQSDYDVIDCENCKGTGYGRV